MHSKDLESQRQLAAFLEQAQLGFEAAISLRFTADHSGFQLVRQEVVVSRVA